MTAVASKIGALDWSSIAAVFDRDGYELLPPILTHAERAEIIALVTDDSRF